VTSQNKKTRIIIGSDHVGITLKQAVKSTLIEWGIEVEDVGAFDSKVSVDYTDYAIQVARQVAQGCFDSGIVICGTGIGVSIAANKIFGIRAALCFDTFTAHQARAHNNANILAMGAWVVTPQRAAGILREWLETPFEYGRHIPRVMKLDRELEAQPAEWEGLQPLSSRYKLGVSISAQASVFSPVLFAGRIEEGFKTAADCGLKLIELSICDPVSIDHHQIKTLIAQYDLQISALATGQNCLQEGLCLAAANPTIRNDTVKRLHSIIDLAQELNAAVIIGGIRGRFAHTPVSEEEKGSFTEALGDCVQYAAQQGIMTLLEPINRYETNFINTLEEGVKLIQEVGVSEFKLLVDTFHMNIEEADIPSSLRKADAYIGYFHIADSQRQAPGQGHTDFRAIFRTLQEINYSGPVVAEILPIPDDRTAIYRLRDFYHSLT